MPKFHYSAIDHQGRVINGTLDAGSENAAVAQLRSTGALPVNVTLHATPHAVEHAGAAGIRELFRRSAFRPTDLADWCDQLSSLLRAGLAIDTALGVVEQGATRQRLRDFCNDLLKDVRDGLAFSAALQRHSADLPPILIPMVQSAELAGALPAVLEDLGNGLAQSARFRDAVRAALIYPSILLSVAIGSVVVVVTMVLPALKSMFDDMQAPLPLLTQLTFGAGTLLRDWGFLIIAGLVALIAGVSMRIRDPQFRARLDSQLLRLRLIGPLLTEVVTVRFCRILGMLLQSGVTLDRAMPIATMGLGNVCAQGQLSSVTRDLKLGRSFSRALEQVAILSPAVLQMIRVGEESGELGPMLNKIAVRLEKSTHQRLDMLLSVLQPVLIIGMACVIGLIVGSLLLAILSINDLAL